MNRKLELTLRYILYFSPSFIKRKVSEAHSRKEIQLYGDICKRTKVNKEEIAEVINTLPIDGKDVLLHTSMAKIGRMQGGPKWFCECMLSKIDTTKQTLLVSALPYRGRFRDYLRQIETFDVRTAPIAMGAINERIADIPEAKRSVHPTHSIVAIGKDADFYTKEHHLDITPFGEHSPYYKLVKNRGKVVMFGADLDSFTLVHVCEDLLGEAYPFRIYDKTIYSVRCVDSKGKELIVKTKCHNPILGIKRDPKIYKDILIKNGIMTTKKLGESEVEVIDAYGFVVCCLEEMKKGNTMYGRVNVKDNLKKQIDNIIENL